MEWFIGARSWPGPGCSPAPQPWDHNTLKSNSREQLEEKARTRRLQKSQEGAVLPRHTECLLNEMTGPPFFGADERASLLR